MKEIFRGKPDLSNSVIEALKRIKVKNSERIDLLQKLKTAEISNSIGKSVDYYTNQVSVKLDFLDLSPIPIRIIRSNQKPLQFEGEKDFQTVIKYCFGVNTERSAFLYTDGESIFTRPIKESGYGLKIASKILTAHKYLKAKNNYLQKTDSNYIKFDKESKDIVRKTGLIRKMASTIPGDIINDNLDTVLDISSQIIYYANSEEEAWTFLQSLTRIPSTSKFNSLQFISALPNNLLANMTHAGIVFRIVDESGSFTVTRELMHLINLTTAGGCPFRNEPFFNNIFEIFIDVAKRVKD